MIAWEGAGIVPGNKLGPLSRELKMTLKRWPELDDLAGTVASSEMHLLFSLPGALLRAVLSGLIY